MSPGDEFFYLCEGFESVVETATTMDELYMTRRLFNMVMNDTNIESRAKQCNADQAKVSLEIAVDAFELAEIRIRGNDDK